MQSAVFEVYGLGVKSFDENGLDQSPTSNHISMNIQINNCNVSVLDTEVDIITTAVETITGLPAGSTVAIWPDSVGRQILLRVGKTAVKPITVFTLGSFKGYDLADFLKSLINNDKVTVTQTLPEKINIAFINPRPTTLDAAVIVPAAADRPYKLSTLVGEIGAAFGFEDQHAEADSKSSDSDQNVVVIDQLVAKTEKFIYIFKGDLYKDSCVGVLEKKLSIGGQLLTKLGNKPVSALTDVLSASLLTPIQKPWLQKNFTWSPRSAKMALCQTATKLQKKIADITVQDLNQNDIPIKEQELTQYQPEVLADLKSRIVTIDESFFNKTQKLKVMLFSPHPDDDVISAGAAVKSLCCQDNVEFHVTYCVSGNVSVPDKFVQIKIDIFKVPVKDDGTGHDLLGDQITYNAEPHNESGKIQQTHFVVHENLSTEEATKRFSTGPSPRAKGLLREVEAQSGLYKDNFFNKKSNSAHFMRLPFYGSGFGKRSAPGDDDIQICLRLIKEVNPNVIFLAGDLSDPHGTHGHCYFAIKEAIEIFEKEQISKLAEAEYNKLYSVYNTRIVQHELSIPEIHKLVETSKVSYKLMYRGAWAEFNIEDATYIIKFTQKQMDDKMTAIRQHESQMGEALYLGGDGRAFDVRARERNEGTAKLLKTYGLIEDEFVGAECFVGCGLLP